MNSNIDLFLQIWSGVFNLLAKLLLAAAEKKTDSGKMRIAGWVLYLLGVPAWVIIFASKNNWVAAAVDTSSIPAMILGIATAHKLKGKVPRVFDMLVRYFTILMILAGAAYSLFYFKGITAGSQILEIFVTTGFLAGTYLLAKKNPIGWIFFALMCLSTGTLMLIQGRNILAIQQGICFFIVVYGFITARYTLRQET